jgi:TolB-like protein
MGAAVVGVLVLRPRWRIQLADPLSEDEAPLVVGVMEFEPQGTAADLGWMCRNTRDGINAVLSNLEELRVYAKEMIDFLEKKRDLTRIEVARELGITKMVTGRMAERGAMVSLEVQVGSSRSMSSSREMRPLRRLPARTASSTLAPGATFTSRCE